jgi:hypothetical protein
MEKFGTIFGHFEYITAIWYSLYTFGIFCGNLVFLGQFGTFSHFGKLCQEESGNPDHKGQERRNVLKQSMNWQFCRRGIGTAQEILPSALPKVTNNG